MSELVDKYELGKWYLLHQETLPPEKYSKDIVYRKVSFMWKMDHGKEAQRSFGWVWCILPDLPDIIHLLGFENITDIEGAE